MMEKYEIMLIIRPDVETEGQQEILDGLSSVIAKNEGTVDTVLDWHKRRLAYEIDKHKDGYYYLVYFSAPGTIIPEIEHYFRVTDTVIRYMIVRADEKEYAAAADKAKAAVEAAAAAEAVAPDQVEETAPEAEETAETEAASSPAETEAVEPVTEPAETEAAEPGAEDEEPGADEEVEEKPEEDKTDEEPVSE
jgi:small subunit ribosomal protein S6